MKETEASSNARNGMVIDGTGITSVDLKGSIFLRHNEANGLVTDNISLNIYENGGVGLVLRSETIFDVEVKKGRSLISCENVNRDIRNDDDSTFGDDGFA